jgi:phosphate transport system permease protein
MRAKLRTALSAHGQPMVWLFGGALAVCLLMIFGLLVLIVREGLATFWPEPLVQVKTTSGKVFLGEVIREEEYKSSDGRMTRRRLLNTANFEISGSRHEWVSDTEIAEETRPEWAVLVERSTNDGRFNGILQAFLIDKEEVATDPAAAWALFNQHHSTVLERLARIDKIKKDKLGEVSHEQNEARLAVKDAQNHYGISSPQYVAAKAREGEIDGRAAAKNKEIMVDIADLGKENARYQMRFVTADGKEKLIPLSEIVRAYPANRIGFGEKMGIYLSRWWEFLWDEPRNSNTEGGVFPAIFGTAVMTILMSLAVVPFGVMAALYLREYAKAGPIISAIRIAINNLAGVPSIVFGVFGLAFFIYTVGGTIDQFFFSSRLPNPTYGTGGILWASLTLALLTLPVVIVATEEALAAVPRSMREGSYACGASKWQTIRRIVLPRALPGILTGTILAMARGAGEVAPLMITGALKLAPSMPIDGYFPFVHPNRSFMHLGFHIFDLGFQSPDSESAKPMVFTTTLLLIVLIATLNLFAMWLRMRLRKRYAGGQF